MGEEAALARLRRVCDKSKKGELQVDEQVYKLWKKAKRDARLKLAKDLQACGWTDGVVEFNTRVMKKWIYKKSTRRTINEGWYSPSDMMETLKWSKDYCKKVIAYCEKRGSGLVRKSKYDENCKEYYITSAERVEREEAEEEHEEYAAAQAEGYTMSKLTGAMNTDMIEDPKQEGENGKPIDGTKEAMEDCRVSAG